MSWGYTSGLLLLRQCACGWTAGPGQGDKAPAPLQEALGLGNEAKVADALPALTGEHTHVLVVLCLTLQNHHHPATSLRLLPDKTDLCRMGLWGSPGFGQEKTPAGDGGKWGSDPLTPSSCSATTPVGDPSTASRRTSTPLPEGLERPGLP